MKSTVSELPAIRARLSRYTPAPLDINVSREAAVALALRQRQDEVEMLFIQRATAEQDPWSGQIAFPGGGREAVDQDLVDTAIRETAEETALLLSRPSMVQHLLDQQGSSKGGKIDLRIRCFVFEAEQQINLVPNYEVAEVFWSPLSRLQDPQHRISFEPAVATGTYQGIDLGPGAQGQERILWGLTYRFVQQLLSLI